MGWATVRDVLALADNPATLRVRDIAQRLGICEDAARALRTLATRTQPVTADQLRRQRQRGIDQHAQLRTRIATAARPHP